MIRADARNGFVCRIILVIGNVIRQIAVIVAHEAEVNGQVAIRIVIDIRIAVIQGLFMRSQRDRRTDNHAAGKNAIRIGIAGVGIRICAAGREEIRRIRRRDPHHIIANRRIARRQILKLIQAVCSCRLGGYGRPGHIYGRRQRCSVVGCGKQFHDHACDAFFAGVLLSVAVCVIPDIVAEADRLIEAEIHALIVIVIRIVVAGFAFRCQCHWIALNSSTGRIAIGIGIIIVIRIRAAGRQQIAGRRRHAHDIIAGRQICKCV